jgi:hypothetical protein
MWSRRAHSRLVLRGGLLTGLLTSGALGCGGNGNAIADDGGAPPGSPAAWGLVSDGGACANGQSPCAGICNTGRCIATLGTAWTLRAAGLGPIAVDSTDVYCLSESVLKVPIDGGTATTLSPGSQASSGTIALEGARVYWQGFWALDSIPKAGFLATPVVTVGPDGLGTGFAVDATGIYWTSLRDSTMDPLFDVVKTPLEATGGGTAITLASSTGQPSAVAVDAVSVYWAERTVNGQSGQSSLEKAPLAGGEVTTLGTSLDGLSVFGGSIAVASNDAYWITTTGDLLRVPLSGGAVATLVSAASTKTQVASVAVDDTSVYWTQDALASPTRGSVVKLPLSGGTPITLASATGWSVEGIAVDATSVYCTGIGSPAPTDQWLMRITPK